VRHFLTKDIYNVWPEHRLATNKGGNEYVLLIECSLDYPAPVLSCQIMFFLTVEPPVTMCTVKVADIVNVDRTVHWLFCLEQLISGHFLEDANVKRHFAQKVGYTAAINEVYHIHD
jgi:hypothetical protein